MNLSRVKVWGAQILYASDLNAEFNNIINHELDDDDIKAGAGIQLTKLQSGVNGDIIYYSDGWKKLAKGTDDQILKLVSGLPSWENP